MKRCCDVVRYLHNLFLKEIKLYKKVQNLFFLLYPFLQAFFVLYNYNNHGIINDSFYILYEYYTYFIYFIYLDAQSLGHN